MPLQPHDGDHGERLQRAIEFVEANFERIGRQAAVRLGIAGNGYIVQELCRKLRHRALELILAGKCDFDRGVEQFVRGVAGKLRHEVLKEWYRERKRQAGLQELWPDSNREADDQELDALAEWSLAGDLMDDRPSGTYDRHIQELLDAAGAELPKLRDEALDQSLAGNHQMARSLAERIALVEEFTECNSLDRTLVFLTYWRGQKVIDTARKLNVSPDALHQRLHRFKDRVRRRVRAS